MNKRIERTPAGALQALCRYPWPGNIRELENLIERAVILSSGPELLVELPELRSLEASAYRPRAARAAAVAIPTESADEPMNLEDAERAHILRALHDTNWIVAGSEARRRSWGLTVQRFAPK